MSEVIQILLVEDQSIARLALHTIIDARPDMSIAAETGTGAEAVALHLEHQPDVTIMDLRLPGMSGFDAIAAIRRQTPAARILVLSNYEGSADVNRALQAGAMAYLTKDTGKEELIQAILSVHKGKRYLPAAVGAILAEQMQGSELTEREMDVLRLLAKGFSNRSISDALSIAENTTRIHVGRILDKLGVEDRTQAVILAIQRGLVHVD
ncbi:MAG: response regulator transcription factor [Bryobacterales bacterium]|nr:response regulator transcription factor [Bryobacterales bacterium]